MRMFHGELTIIICLAAAVLVSAPPGCPSKEDVYPCECDPTDNKTYPTQTLTCTKIDDSGVLRRIFQNTIMQYYYHIFALVDSKLQYIPHIILDEGRLGILSLHNVTLTYLFDEVPKDTWLRELKAVRVKITSNVGWNWKQLAGFKRLELLDIRDTPLQSRLQSAFRSSVTRNLRRLSLKNCGIQSLQNGVFADLTLLELFDLSSNSIVDIRRSDFPRKASLKSILLMYNKISRVPSDMFSDMPFLEMVSLRGNRMVELSEATFRPVVSRLRYLDVTENFIKCDCQIAWVLKERLDRISGKCSAPNALLNKHFSKLTQEDFLC